VLNLHHLPESITACVGDGADLGVSVRYSWEDPVLGSAGGPRRALGLLPEDDFFIINGDTLTDLDLEALAAAHRSTGADVTMALVPNRWPGKYGGAITDAEGRIHGFVPRGSTAASYHFFGVQIARPSVFAGLNDAEPAETVGGLYRSLISEKLGSIRGFLCTAPFYDVGTAADYLEAALAVGRNEGLPSTQVGQRSRIHETAAVVESVLWDDVEIGAGAALRRCVVADRVRIPEGARFENSAIVQRGSELGVFDING
jgi:mannose-1-phosphate guanylyltransferase